MERKTGNKTNMRILCAVLLLALCCLGIGFFRAGNLYPVDYGQYERIMTQCGLTWTEADLARGGLQYERPITTFEYTRFSWSALLTPQGGGALVYVTALCRLILQPLGLPLSLQAVGAVLALVLAAGTTMLAAAFRRLFPRGWFSPVLLLLEIYADGNFCVMLRSLYPEGAAIAFGILTTGLAFLAYSLPVPRRRRLLIPVTILTFITLKTLTPLVVFLPLALAGIGALAFSCRLIHERKLLLAGACTVLLLTGCVSTIQTAASDPDYFSYASGYESVFQGMLPASENPEEILGELGLEPDYADDIGKSYYEEEAAYTHDPRAEEEKLKEILTSGNILKVYFRHPGLLYSVVERIPVSMDRGFENGRNLSTQANDAGFFATRASDSLLLSLWRFVPHSWSLFAVVQGCLMMGSVIWGIRRKKWKAPGLSLAACCSILFLPFCTALDGYAQSQEYMLFQIFMDLMLWSEGLLLLSAALPVLVQWLSRYTADPYLPEAIIPAPAGDAVFGQTVTAGLRRAVRWLTGCRRRVILLTAVLGCVLLVCVLVPASHPVSVNNGDFGRMMIQMDLTWTSELYFDSEAQAVHGGIEEYEYLRPFDPLKLTPLKPTYSLYWFVSAVRLLTQPFGRPFSTWVLAWVMGILSLICVISLTRDLYPLLKSGTVAVSLILLAILFSETSLTWYNSLYGEGCILLGMTMTLACAVHLCLAPREKSWTRLAWLAGLGWSLLILVTAKAQMLMALPGAIGIFLALSIYQRAYRYDLQAVQGLAALTVCALLAFSAVSVYRTDRTEDSVSQKHTMWQAYFYGIFMISDDPVGDMEALGIDTAMEADIGKYVDFSDDAGYVYAPLSAEAEEAFYNHVSMGTIISWYLTHPGKLWYMLNHAAREARELYTSFRVYKGQDYSDPDHDPVNGWDFWPGWRSWLTPGSFFGYILYYGAILVCLILAMGRRELDSRIRMLSAAALFVMITGVLQFPLSVLGNGFADNQKQLFCFSLCHDFLLGSTLVAAGWILYKGNIPAWLVEAGKRIKKNPEVRKGEPEETENGGKPAGENEIIAEES